MFSSSPSVTSCKMVQYHTQDSDIDIFKIQNIVSPQKSFTLLFYSYTYFLLPTLSLTPGKH